jgi:hypothetical protein
MQEVLGLIPAPKKKKRKDTTKTNKKPNLTGCRCLVPINPSYSGGRDQEERGLKPAQLSSS